MSLGFDRFEFGVITLTNEPSKEESRGDESNPSQGFFLVKAASKYYQDHGMTRLCPPHASPHAPGPNAPGLEAVALSPAGKPNISSTLDQVRCSTCDQQCPLACAHQLLRI